MQTCTGITDDAIALTFLRAHEDLSERGYGSNVSAWCHPRRLRQDVMDPLWDPLGSRYGIRTDETVV